MKTNSVQVQNGKIAKAAVLIALLSIAVLAAGYCSFHWFTTADENNPDALAQQAANYLNYDKLYIEEVAQKGNYLAALCRSTEGNWCMCVFVRDRLFGSRWRANGGNRSMKDGTICSWNYGSPQGEAVLIFCGGNIPDEVCWYEFQNSKITYTCPVEHDKLLDVFIIPDGSNDINGSPILLDNNQQEISPETWTPCTNKKASTAMPCMM